MFLTLLLPSEDYFSTWDPLGINSSMKSWQICRIPNLYSCRHHILYLFCSPDLRDFLCLLLFTRCYTCDGAEQDNSYPLQLQGSIEGNIVHMSNLFHPAEREAEVPFLSPIQLYSSKQVTCPPRHDSASQEMRTDAT